MPPVAVGVALGLGAAAVGASVTVLGVGLSAALSAVAIGVGGAAVTHFLGDALTPDMGDYASDPATDQSLIVILITAGLFAARLPVITFRSTISASIK